MRGKSRIGCSKVVTDKAINTIRTLLNRDHRLTLRELEMIMNNYLGDSLSRILISCIVTEKLGFSKVCARWVPH